MWGACLALLCLGVCQAQSQAGSGLAAIMEQSLPPTPVESEGPLNMMGSDETSMDIPAEVPLDDIESWDQQLGDLAKALNEYNPNNENMMKLFRQGPKNVDMRLNKAFQYSSSAPGCFGCVYYENMREWLDTPVADTPEMKAEKKEALVSLEHLKKSIIGKLSNSLTDLKKRQVVEDMEFSNLQTTEYQTHQDEKKAMPKDLEAQIKAHSAPVFASAEANKIDAELTDILKHAQAPSLPPLEPAVVCCSPDVEASATPQGNTALFETKEDKQVLSDDDTRSSSPTSFMELRSRLFRGQ